MQDWTVQKKFTLLLSALAALVVMNIIGMVEIAKTGHFTFLEREHLVGLETTKLSLERIASAPEGQDISSYISNRNRNYREQGLVQGMNFAKQQAEACLDAVNFIEVLLFRMLGFGEAIDICYKDLDANAQGMQLVTQLQRGDLDKETFMQRFAEPTKLL